MTEPIRRQAVDATTENYWESYFGDYGRAWVRKIPRRVATALIARTASLMPGAAAEMASRSHVVPVAERPVVTAKAVHVEGALVTPDGTQRLFCATFDHDGRLTALDTI